MWTSGWLRTQPPARLGRAMELGIYTFADAPARRVVARGSACATCSRRSSSPTRSGSTCSASASTTGRTSPSRRRPSSLAAAAARTRRIRLTSAVTVLSSDDPVRVFQEFATLDLLSGGRAEIMAGRGSFIESFPLFGYDLDDYDELFAEKLELLLALREGERVTWAGPAPRAARRPRRLPAPGAGAAAGVDRGRRQRRSRWSAPATLGLPMALAIIGGLPERFAPFVELLPRGGRRAGHDPRCR